MLSEWFGEPSKDILYTTSYKKVKAIFPFRRAFFVYFFILVVPVW